MKGFHHPLNKTAKLMLTCKTLAKIYFMLLVNFLTVFLSSMFYSYMILTEVTPIAKRFVPFESLKKCQLKITNFFLAITKLPGWNFLPLFRSQYNTLRAVKIR